MVCFPMCTIQGLGRSVDMRFAETGGKVDQLGEALTVEKGSCFLAALNRYRAPGGGGTWFRYRRPVPRQPQAGLSFV